jgi:predicted dehydrogenase
VKQVEIGVIGAGWWACAAHIPTLIAHPAVKSVSVVRPDREGLDKVLRHFKLEHGYTSAEQMLAERPLAGAVISSPHVFHAEHALLAINHGLNVLVEKPFGTSIAEARAIANAAADKGVSVMMPYGWNYRPMTETAHRLIRDGYIGEVRHVVAQMASSLADLFAGQGLKEAEDALFQPAASTWADPKRAGGYGWGQLTHGLGALFRLIDLDPVEIYAKMGKSEVGVDYYDAAVVTFANGATMSLSGSGTIPKVRGGFQVDIRVFGTEGMLLYDVERARVEAYRHDGKSHVETLPADAGEYDSASPAARFAELCAGEKVVNPADATIGRRATEVLDGMYRSARSGKPEEIAP